VGDWFLTRRPQSRSVGALLCVPPAGGQAQLFTPWARMLPSITLIAVRMPGRGWRHRESPATDIKEAANELAASIGDELDQPFVIFGHSFGAILGFEIAKALAGSGGVGPLMLCVSASPAPHCLPVLATQLLAAPTTHLAAVFKQLAPVPSELLRAPQILGRAVENFRGDLKLLARYRPDPWERVLPIPIHAFLGAADTSVRRADVLEWRRLGTSFHYTEHHGGHSAILARPAPVARAVAHALHITSTLRPDRLIGAS
jgi:medium-chain acyl-[acyl-carrier-protein] hydrolase